MEKIFFKNYSCWRINTVKWCVGTQRAIDTTVSERDLFSRGKSLARECLNDIAIKAHKCTKYVIKTYNVFIFLVSFQYFKFSFIYMS